MTRFTKNEYIFRRTILSSFFIIISQFETSLFVLQLTQANNLCLVVLFVCSLV
jgi:hypothetical protein